MRHYIMMTAAVALTVTAILIAENLGVKGYWGWVVGLNAGAGLFIAQMTGDLRGN